MSAQNDTGPIAPETTELAERLRHVIGGFVRAVRTEAGTPTSVQSETLGLLDRQGAMSVADMAALRNVRHQSMRLVIGQLEAQDLVSRTTDPKDRRSQLIVLTQKGTEMLANSRSARTAWIADCLEHAVSEEERRNLSLSIDVLQRVVETETARNRKT
jgi:DNA-binding MarR family transcriptional regulator